MTIFEEVKELVDVPTAARQYGVEVRRNNFALCPFHNERTPSCKLYADHYHCYGCGAHGDVIGLVQGIFNLTPMDAVKQLNQDFGLGLDVSRPPKREDIERIQRQKKERFYFSYFEIYASKVLREYLWKMREWSKQYAPSKPEETQDKRFVYAMHHLEYAEHIANEFAVSSMEERHAMKEVVEEIERELAEVRVLDADDRTA